MWKTEHVEPFGECVRRSTSVGVKIRSAEPTALIWKMTFAEAHYMSIYDVLEHAALVRIKKSHILKTSHFLWWLCGVSLSNQHIALRFLYVPSHRRAVSSPVGTGCWKHFFNPLFSSVFHFALHLLLTVCSILQFWWLFGQLSTSSTSHASGYWREKHPRPIFQIHKYFICRDAE